MMTPPMHQDDTGFSRECCADMVEVKTWVIQHDKRHATIDEVLDRLLNRLPLWATTIAAIAGGLIGSMLTVILFLAKAM